MSESTMPTSKPTQDSTKASITIPDGYKIVKVRKPDGTIVKVRRPIAKIADPSATTTSEGSEKKIEGPSSKLNENQAAVKLPSTETPSKTTAVVSSDPLVSKAESSKPLTTTPAHASKLETAARSYRVFHKIHRVHRHASRLVSAFDPFSDVGDLQDRDESLGSDGDTDSDDEHSKNSDDEDQNNRNQQSSATGKDGMTKTEQLADATIGSGAAQQKSPSTTKPASPKVDVREVPAEKSSSIETDPIIREKEMFDPKDLEAANSQTLHPQTLFRYSVDLTTLIAWALVILFPLLFIALAVAMAGLEHKPYGEYSGYGYRMVHATKFGVTAWPIIFAGILAQTLKACATYRVERGIRLLTLEQLISSHSVSSALKQPFVLRRINWMTIGLLELWGLSPLGSQALQYTTHPRPNLKHNDTTAFYLNTLQPNHALELDFPNGTKETAEASFSDSMDVLYATVFQPGEQDQYPGSDPWGNPLLPRFEVLAKAADSNQGWINVDEAIDAVYDDSDGLNVTDFYSDFYSSYYGIPVAEFTEDDGTWNFTMHASYLHFDIVAFNASTLAELSEIGFDPEDDDAYSMTAYGSLHMNMKPPSVDAPTGSVNFFSQCSEKLSPDGNATWAYASLNFSQYFIDTNVSCSYSNCSVSSMKKVTGTPTNIYPFAEEFMKASDTGLNGYPDLGDTIHTATEIYIASPDNVTIPGAGKYCDIPSLDVGVFTTRFSYLMNTFYSTGFTHAYSSGTINSTEKIELYDAEGNPYNANLTLPADAIRYYTDPDAPEIYIVNWAWLSVFGACSLILFLIAIASVLLEMRTIRSDILSFASSVARHSKYIKLPDTDGAMSGADKARLLGDTVVIMQDARPTAGIGKIVLGTSSESAERVRPGRQYR